MNKFLREPPSVRAAAGVIVAATATVVGGVRDARRNRIPRSRHAAITSSFVARAEQERAIEEGAEDAALEERLDARFDEIERRFDRLESMIGEGER